MHLLQSFKRDLNNVSDWNQSSLWTQTFLVKVNHKIFHVIAHTTVFQQLGETSETKLISKMNLYFKVSWVIKEQPPSYNTFLWVLFKVCTAIFSILDGHNTHNPLLQRIPVKTIFPDEMKVTSVSNARSFSLYLQPQCMKWLMHTDTVSLCLLQQCIHMLAVSHGFLHSLSLITFISVAMYPFSTGLRITQTTT